MEKTINWKLSIKLTNIFCTFFFRGKRSNDKVETDDPYVNPVALQDNCSIFSPDGIPSNIHSDPYLAEIIGFSEECLNDIAQVITVYSIILPLHLLMSILSLIYLMIFFLLLGLCLIMIMKIPTFLLLNLSHLLLHSRNSSCK